MFLSLLSLIVFLFNGIVKFVFVDFNGLFMSVFIVRYIFVGDVLRLFRSLCVVLRYLYLGYGEMVRYFVIRENFFRYVLMWIDVQWQQIRVLGYFEGVLVYFRYCWLDEDVFFQCFFLLYN